MEDLTNREIIMVMTNTINRRIQAYGYESSEEDIDLTEEVEDSSEEEEDEERSDEDEERSDEDEEVSSTTSGPNEE
ncbi:hypothetical protein [Klebsiella pneumoniae]|uniref:hypothetical protein n=1 Tax=Klebsiella pneumoniae TaxID=573 RepID=UPI001179E612|nr:hypothetical protein [Klebsiella pneumoniae]